MAKLNYDKDVKPLVTKLNVQFEAAKNLKLDIKPYGDKYVVYQYNNSTSDDIWSGTLRECFSFLNGMAEFLI